MTTRQPHCYWCGTEIFPVRAVGNTHPKCATIDHIRSKPECVTKKEYNDKRNQVPACYQCNQRRSKEWCARMESGLVHPTEWSLRVAAKNRRRIERKKQKALDAEILKHCKPCPVVRIKVPQELSEAFGT